MPICWKHLCCRNFSQWTPSADQERGDSYDVERSGKKAPLSALWPVRRTFACPDLMPSALRAHTGSLPE